MILALTELSKFLQATTAPFSGFQGDLEVVELITYDHGSGGRPGMKFWRYCL